MSSRIERLIGEQLDKHGAQDLRTVLGTEAGRRFFSTVVFGVCEYGTRCLDFDIKDGGAAAKHQDFLDGMQEVGRKLLYFAQKHCPELWLAAESERIARTRQEAELHNKETK